jgi:tight adherence protein C
MLIFIPFGIIAVLYILSNNKYETELERLNKKDYPLKDFLPMGFYAMDLIKYKYRSKYDQKINLILLEIYGVEEVIFNSRVHWARHIAFFLVALLFCGVLSLDAESDNTVVMLMFLGIGIVFPYLDIKKKLDKKRIQMQIDFPDFLNKLTLLVGAGMTVSSAWSKIVEETNSDRPLYREMEKVYFEVRSGKSEIEAYERFAKRCRMPVVTKFVSVLLQNLRKGSGELIKVLDSLSDECWEMRKNAAKRIGEEASTKMMLPMMIMLAGIFIVIFTPILLEFQNM